MTQKVKESSSPKSKESKKVLPRIETRTDSERRVFTYLPDSIKDEIWRNRRVSFRKCVVFYPDFFLPEAKIVMEIDGSIHKDKRHQRKDKRKDREFDEHGYSMLRFWNEETVDKISFLHKLYYRLLGIEGLRERKYGQRFIEGIEDILYANDEDEFGIDASEFSMYGMSVRME